jgi:hypothetical protein
MRRTFVMSLCLLLSIAFIAGCTDRQEDVDLNTKFAIQLEHTELSVLGWKMDNSHVASLKGKVVMGDQPVIGVELKLAGKRSVVTNEDGSFEYLIDRSLPQMLAINVISADHTKIAGKPVKEQDKQDLLAATATVKIYYPIQIMNVKQAGDHPELVEVQARALPEKNQDFPITALIQYAIKGTVKSADGTPVKGATVSFSRDNGEGWGRSEPSNEKGAYILYYAPEPEEDLNLNVHVGLTKYTLPENRVYHFPEDTSVQTDITLPEDGTVILDKPPTLVSRPVKGGVNWSLMIGVDTKENYTVTLPQKDGSFTLTLPKKVWDQSPSFFQTRVTRFLDDPVKAGDALPSSLIPTAQPNDPTGIVPIPQQK